MVRFKTLSRDEAKRIISAFDNYDDVEFDDLVNHWEQYDPVSEYDESFVDFRNELLAAFREGLQETNGKMDYPVDLKVGLKIYSLLPIGKNFSIVQANNDDFWRYISVKVMPDITYLRYPNPEKAVKDAGGRLNHKRFYAQTRRIWLKSLWWYVFLSWQGSELKTYNALKNNKTDNINKLIETPGRGYRLMLYRAMIAEYAKYSALNKTSTKEFAAFTKLNNAKCVNVEPALTPGGEKGYAHRLFEELRESEEMKMTLAEEILNNWNTDIPGYAHTIDSLEKMGYPAWTILNSEEYGVVLAVEEAGDINEAFANARIVSKEVVFEDGFVRRALTLTSSSTVIEETFASLCAALVTPGSKRRK
mgnify:CR=1 FL=1